MNVLVQGGVEVHRAGSDFEVDGTAYQSGSYIVYASQAFRPYVIDLFEPQSYPDRRRTPDGPPDPPYDLAGWTLPMQMGVSVDRVVEPFDVDTTPLSAEAEIAPGGVTSGSFGYLISHRLNASTIAVNRLLAAGDRVHWIEAEFELDGSTFPSGTILVENGDGTRARLDTAASELGIDVHGIEASPPGVKHRLEPVHVGLYKSWVANMDEGWTRWLLENYEFQLTNLTNQDLQTGDLSGFDVIVLPHQNERQLLNGHPEGTMPAQYVGGIGLDGSLGLRRWVADGGTLVTLDGASDFAIQQFGLPLRNAVADTTPNRFLHSRLAHSCRGGRLTSTRVGARRRGCDFVRSLARV